MLARAGNLLSINATTLMRAFDEMGNRNSKQLLRNETWGQNWANKTGEVLYLLLKSCFNQSFPSPKINLSDLFWEWGPQSQAGCVPPSQPESG
jgi:hypothetical protein